jgi:HlyD family secretion protein
MTTQPEQSKQAIVAPLSQSDAGQPAAAKRPLRKRRSPWPVRIGVILAVVACGLYLAWRAKKKPIAVETIKVERGAVVDEISSSSAGEVMATRTVMVRAELMGRVLTVRHKRGDRVKGGDIVVALDASDLSARLDQAAATLDTQRAQLGQSEVHAEAQANSAGRAQRLAEHGAETTQVAEDAAAEAREAKAAAKAARAQLDQGQAALRVARVARSHTNLAAPFDGLLADVFVNSGDEIQIGTNIFQVVDDSELHVEANIDEADIGRVKVGQPAALRLDALPDRPVAGLVSKLDPTVRKDEKGARNLRIEVSVTNLAKAVKAGIRPGMSANVDVQVAEKLNVLSLPTNVIIGRGTKRSVYVIANGIARARSVQTGLSSWERTEIVSGLGEGDVVVGTLNVQGLADGMPVRETRAATLAVHSPGRQ